MVSESPLGDSTEAVQANEEVPELVDEPDNDPDDSAEYVAGETQDREGTERPEVDKHPEDD
jgi:hypothetical protein